jgi:hypothetical protein
MAIINTESLPVTGRTALITQYRTSLALLWVMLATSSIVFIEPAPYDMLGFALLAAFFMLGLRIPVGLRNASILLGIFFLANVIASALTPEPADSFRALAVRFYMLATWLLFTCLVFEDPGRVIRVLFSGYLAAAVITVTAGALGYYKLVPYTAQLVEFGRVRSTFKDANVYGPFLVPVIMYLVARIETAPRLDKLYLGGLFAYMIFGILIGYSRGSWVNLLVALLVYFMLRLLVQKSSQQKRRLMLQGGGLILFAALFLGWVSTTDQIRDLAAKRVHVQYYDFQEGRGRFVRQKWVLERSLTEPLGIGAGQSEQPFFFNKAPHNVYLHVLIESGWIGALAFFSFIGLTLWKSLHFLFRESDIQPVYIAVFASVIGILFQSLFVDSTHWRHMYLLFGMLWGPLLVPFVYTQHQDRVTETAPGGGT